MPQTHRIAARRRRARPGFTLVELLVALLLIDVGVLGMVATTAKLARQTTALRARGIATQLAANRIQSLAAGPCVAVSGTSSTQAATEYWTAVAGANGVHELRDSVVFTINGAERHVVVQSRLKC